MTRSPEPREDTPALIPLGESDSAVCEDGFCVVPPAPADPPVRSDPSGLTPPD